MFGSSLRPAPRGLFALILATALVGASCTGGAKPIPSPSAPALPEGGTLRIALPKGGFFSFFDQPIPTKKGLFHIEFDPAADVGPPATELFRCCLLRTLFSYNGHPTRQGGTKLHPDLAAGMPTVSPDLLTWTIRLKAGLHYGPPYQGTEITAKDVIRAVERQFIPNPPPLVAIFGPGTIGGLATDFNGITGTKEFGEGKADHISGLEAPDAHTLLVHLTHPEGDLPYLFSLEPTAPLPPGAADGHVATYGRFLVSSGPYMFEGSQNLDFSRPPKEQQPVSGFVPGESITLVRNPSWDPATDSLRKAYVDRMVFTIGGTVDDAYRAVSAGREDLVLDADPSAPVYERALTAPGARQHTYNELDDTIVYLVMNVAAPPFDDVHVRKAVSFAMEKSRLQQINAVLPQTGMGPFSQPIGHTIPDSMEDNLLVGYDPYPFDLSRAKEEMAQSTYDRNGDGICDAPACRNVYAAGRSDLPFFPKAARVIRDDLRKIGIDLHIDTFDDFQFMLSKVRDPKNHVPVTIGVRFAKDYPNATPFFTTVLSGASIFPNGSNLFLVGATSDQLAGWGYRTRTVPSIDARINQCVLEVGSVQTRCWADLDQVVMEEVVPYVPYLAGTETRIASTRVLNITYDQFADMPALDQIAVPPGS
jgi:peptide/nickel transport system substrate-binding protein